MTLFKPEYAVEDVDRIDIAFPGMEKLKADLKAYLIEYPALDKNSFAQRLTALCKSLPGNKLICLSPLPSPEEEAPSKRRNSRVEPGDLGWRKVPMKFAYKRLATQLGRIRNDYVRNAFTKEFDIKDTGTRKAKSREFTREEWEAFCMALRQSNEHPGVIKVSVNVGQAAENDDEDEPEESSPETSSATLEGGADDDAERDEYVESTKSPKAYLKGASHKGYFLYLDAKGKPRRWPIYTHESFKSSRKAYGNKKRDLQNVPGSRFREIAFLQTGCLIELTRPTPLAVRLGRGKEKQRVSLPKGIYRLNYLNSSMKVKLTTQNGDLAEAQVGVFIQTNRARRVCLGAIRGL